MYRTYRSIPRQEGIGVLCTRLRVKSNRPCTVLRTYLVRRTRSSTSSSTGTVVTLLRKAKMAANLPASNIIMETNEDLRRHLGGKFLAPASLTLLRKAKAGVAGGRAGLQHHYGDKRRFEAKC